MGSVVALLQVGGLRHRSNDGPPKEPKSSVLRVAAARTLEICPELCFVAHACPREFRLPDSSRSTNCLSLAVWLGE